MARHKPSGKKKHLSHALRQAQPVPSWVVAKTEGKVRRIWNAPREKRTPRAVRFLREFVAQRMKTTEVSLSEETNSMLWQRGISKPPRKIRIRVVKDKEGRVIVFPGEGKSRASNTV